MTIAHFSQRRILGTGTFLCPFSSWAVGVQFSVVPFHPEVRLRGED
jgi:hypothetical protein